MSFQENQVKETIPAAELVIDDPVQGVTPTINDGNLFIANRRPLRATEQPVAFMTRFNAEAMLKNEKEKASVSSIYLDLKTPYVAEVAAKPYPVGYITSQFQKFNGRRGNKWEHAFHFLNLWEVY